MDTRTRRWLLPVLAAALALLAVYLVAWVTTPTPRLLRADFVNAYMGGQILRDGHGARLYDLGLQAHMYRTLTAPMDYPLLAFYDTPSAALLAMPFTLLGVVSAWRLFSLLQLALVVAAAVIAARSAPWPERTSPLIRMSAVAAAVAGLSTDVLLLQGQWSGVFAFGAAMGYRELRRGRQASAVFWLLAPVLAVKPNLAIGLVAFTIGWGGRRALGGLAAAVGVVLAASLLVGGPSIVGAFLHAGVSSRSVWPLSSMDGITGITGRLLGAGDAADAVGFGVCLVVGGLAFPLGRCAARPGRLEPALAGAVALTLLASPHLYPHDLAMLTPAAVWFMAWAYRGDRAEACGSIPRRLVATMAGWAAFNVAAGTDQGAASGHLVPWTLLAIAVATIAAAGMLVRNRPLATAHRST